MEYLITNSNVIAPHLDPHTIQNKMQIPLKTQETETLINGICRSNEEMSHGAFSDEVHNNFFLFKCFS